MYLKKQRDEIGSLMMTIILCPLETREEKNEGQTQRV